MRETEQARPGAEQPHAAPDDVDPGAGRGRVEPGGQHDRVQPDDGPVGQLDPLRPDPDDRVPPDGDHLDVVAVEGLQPALVGRDGAQAVVVAGRDQRRRETVVAQSRPHPVADDGGRRGPQRRVRREPGEPRRVQRQGVLVVGGPQAVESSVDRRMRGARHRGPDRLAHDGQAVAVGRALRPAVHRVGRGQHETRGPGQDGEPADPAGQRRDQLDRARPAADDTHPQAVELGPSGGPRSGVDDRPGEV